MNRTFFSAPNSPGKDGFVSESVIKSGILDTTSKRSFPVELLNTVRRQAEDVLLGNSSDVNGREALQFILRVVNERSDLEEVKKCKRFRISFHYSMIGIADRPRDY